MCIEKNVNHVLKMLILYMQNVNQEFEKILKNVYRNNVDHILKNVKFVLEKP